MPTVSGCVRVSPDGQYILATGTYNYDMIQILTGRVMKCLVLVDCQESFSRGLCFPELHALREYIS